MALQLSAKERLMAKAEAVSREQQQVRENTVQQPDLMARLRQQEAERQAKENAARVREQRSHTLDLSGANKAPVSDRAKKVAEIRSDINTTPTQGRFGKGAQSIGLSLPASVEYTGESIRQIAKNQRAYTETALQRQLAEAFSNLNLTAAQYGRNSQAYLDAKAAYDEVAQAIKDFKNQPDKVVDQNSRAAQFMGGVQQLREEALEGTEGAARFLGETALSIGSNLSKLPLAVINPALPAAAMGAEATAGKAYTLGQQGINAGQALSRGLVSGGIEAVTEKMGLDNLFDIVKNGGKSVLKNILKQVGVEGTEEGFSYAFNFLADKMAGDPNASFSLGELLENISAGAISGLVFGAGGSAVNRVAAQDATEPMGLPVVEERNEARLNLPLPEETNGQSAAQEPQSLPMVGMDNGTDQGYNDGKTMKEAEVDGESGGLERANAKSDSGVLRNTGGGIASAYERPRAESPDRFVARERAEGRHVAQVGSYRYGYKPVFDDEYTAAAAETVKECERLGLTVVVSSEPVSVNDEDIQKTKYSRGAATTLYDGTIVVQNLFDERHSGKNIAAHENYHNRVKGNKPDAIRYRDVISQQLKKDSESYIALCDDIKRHYFGADYTGSNEQEDRVQQELNAFISGELYDPVLGLGLDEMFHDLNAVKTAWQDMMDASMDELIPLGPKATEPQGLPMKRREEVQDALTASVNGGRTLGDNERRTGLPLPTAVEGQLEALEALTTPMEDADANIIRKYLGEEAAHYYLEHRNDDAAADESGDLYQRPTPDNSGAVADEEGNIVGTRATEKLGIRVEGGIADMGAVEMARQAQWGYDVAVKQIQKAEKDLRASAAEKRMAESIAKGQDSLDSFIYGWDGKDNRRRSVVEELSALYRMRDLYDRKGIKALGRKNKDVFIDKLNREILNHVQDATPPKGLSLWTNTWSRNNLRTWGRELGEKVNQLIFDPIRRNEANRIRWLDSQASDMKILGELTDAENEAVFDMLDNGKETAAYDGVRNEVVQEAVDKLKTKYAQYYDAINDVLVAHGYPEIGFIKNYAPHKQPEQMKSAMSIFEKLGLSDTVTELPTELAGRTDIFKPGKKWNPHFLHRTGEQAALDAVGGYMSYLNYMSEVLFHVDDIQKVRTFGDQIRYLYGDEGLQADYDAIRADKSLNEQEKELELARIRERQTDNSKMGAYVSHLDDYANIIAGKQAKWDRAAEGVDRRLLNVLQKPVQVLVQSSIPGNISSAINQTVQLPWLTAEAGESNVLQAAWELSRGKLKREGFAGESDFLTGKRGAKNYSKLQDKTAGEKILDMASIPFEAVDDAASQIIVRAFYLKNVKAGMAHEAALRAADTQAEKLVGSRMKGAKPDIFSVKSLKLLTTFQLEVANQWQHLKFDLPQEYREIERTRGAGAAKAEAVKRIVKGTVYTFALNSLIEQITGNKPAGFDIIGAIWDYIRAGLPGEDEEEDGFDFEAGAADLRDSLVDDLPFVGTIATLMGYGDGRLPLPEPDLQNLKSGWSKIRAAETDEEKAAGVRQLLTGVLKTGSAFAPMGNQIRKTIEGGETAIRGGRYTNDGTQLMYEVERSPANIARGLLFGRNALPETREYWDEGGKEVLSQKQTGLMQQAAEYGVDQSTYVGFIQQAKRLQGDKDAEGNTIDGSLERKKISLLDGLDLTGEQKLQLYLDNVASDSRKEDVEAMTAAGMSWEQMAPAIDTYLSMEAEDLGATQKATQLAAWADQNLNGQQAAVVKERLEYWQMMRAEASSYEKLTGAGLSSESAQRVYGIYQSLEPEEGKTNVTETQKQKAVANSRDLSESDKRMAVRSMLDGTALEKFDRCVAAGVKTADYVRVKEFNSNTSADKDKNGKSITGSKKDKVWKYINGLLAVSESGKDALSILCGYDSGLDEAPWHNGVLGLPMLDPPGGTKQVLELPMPESIGGDRPVLMLP